MAERQWTVAGSRSRNNAMSILRSQMPIYVQHRYDFAGRRALLFIVDVIKGFCVPGCGNLAPPVGGDLTIDRMIRHTNDLAVRFSSIERVNAVYQPIIAFKDCHDNPERPFPAHCQSGTVETELVAELSWLEECPNASIIEKPCINAWVGHGTCAGAYPKSGLANIICRSETKVIVVCGICTDLCVMQFVQALLSARTCGHIPEDIEVVVVPNACTTYDLPLEVCDKMGLPNTLSHPRDLNHHLALYYMQQCGAILTNEIVF